MTDVIGPLHEKIRRAEYKMMWDNRYEEIKTGGIVYMMEYMDRGESREAFRQLFSRLVIDIDSLRKEIAALQKERQ